MTSDGNLTRRTITWTWALCLLLAAAPTMGQGDAIFIDSSGNVGVGTSTPVVPLHVLQTSASPSLKNLFRLTNNGGIQFLLDRTDHNDWQFANFGSSFQISIPGGAQAQFQVIANGNVIAGGSMTATQYLTSSSRTLKTDVEAIDGREILDQLAALPISEWSFHGEQTRHIGPMAEDFQEAFGLGQEGQSLSLTDTNGIALAAIKGLYAALGSLEERVEEQSRLIEEQREEIRRLRAQGGEAAAGSTPR